MLEQPFIFTVCSSIQFFNSPPSLNTVSAAARGSLTLTVQWLYDLRDAYWSIGHQALPTTTVQIIFVGMASNLSRCLCSNTSFTSHRKVLLGRFNLYIRGCYGRLYQTLAGFDPTILLIALNVVGCLFYPLGHTAL